MPNTNFQTFHQMGQAINEVVRQATGRDNVQNIDMEHITVAQNHYYQDVDVSGRVVSFHAGAAGLPLEKCVVQIDPVQDLHGYDHPWPAGGGVNKLEPISAKSASNNGLTFTSNGDGSYSVSGTSSSGSSAINIAFDTPTLIKAGTYYMSVLNNSTPSMTVGFYMFANATRVWDIVLNAANKQAMINVPSDIYGTMLQIFVAAAGTVNFTLSPVLSTDGYVSSFAPYSNICPITGWTGANVYVSPTTDAADGQTYTIAFPSEAGTVYGGTLDVTSGVLTVDMVNVDLGSISWSYNSNDAYFYSSSIASLNNKSNNSICSQYKNNLRLNNDDKSYKIQTNGNIVIYDSAYSDKDVFKTAMSGVQLCYELATPITYTFTPQEVTTLLGVNNVWADTGDIEVKFKDLKELY